MKSTIRPNRRNFLRGLGACIALPAMESIMPSTVFGNPVAAEGALGVTATGAPMRMAFVFFPNGAHQKNWFPADGEKLALGACPRIRSDLDLPGLMRY